MPQILYVCLFMLLAFTGGSSREGRLRHPGTGFACCPTAPLAFVHRPTAPVFSPKAAATPAEHQAGHQTFRCKVRLKIRGLHNPLLTIPVLTTAGLQKPSLVAGLLSGMAAYTQPYRLSSEYSFLFRLTPF